MLKNLFNKTNQGEPTMADVTIEDPTAWMINNSMAQFVLMPTSGIVYMCMFAYTFVHGKYVLYRKEDKFDSRVTNDHLSIYI